jgi:dihydrofolate synthase/folylpolyglutamate synthase
MQWLAGVEKYGWVFGLERIIKLIERLGNPQKELKIIHVAGTNGKGSVCHFISSILQQAGYSVGLYVSPHLERFSERIVVNGTEISDDDLEMLVERVRPFVEEMKAQGNAPTFFEIVTALAFLYFHERTVDYAVVEVGLGGRLDATNIVTPLVSVITNISLEHTNILGKSLEEIAAEKAGIIKEGIPVVTAATGSARDVIARIAKEQDVPVVFVGRTWWKRVSWDGREQEFSIQGSLGDYTVRTSLLGIHQGENIAVAIAAVERLQMSGVYIADEDIREGIAAASHPGRMELVAQRPRILLDGAHNPDGMKVLARTLKMDFSYDRLILVLGVLKDKDIPMMISSIVPLADLIIATQSTNSRAYDPVLLMEKIQRFDASKEVRVEVSVAEAVEHAKRLAKRKDLICVSGSLFTVGEARSHLLGGMKNQGG